MERGKGGPAPSEGPTASLQAAIDQFVRSPVRADAEAMSDELLELRHLIDLLELRFSRTASAFASTGAWDEWGSVSPIHWIKSECMMTGGAAADRIRVGEHMDRLQASTQAVVDERIGFAHLAVIARTAEALENSPTAASFDERPVLEKAKRLTVGRLWRFCYHVRHAADPEKVAQDEAEAAGLRRLKLSPGEDGSLLIDGWLDSIGGAALRTALEPLARPAGKDDDRCREHRLADALVELASHDLDTGLLPQHRSQRPHLQVTTSFETLKALRGSPAAEMEFSFPISAKTVQRLACDSTITRVVLGSDSVVIDVGRAKRVVAGSVRRALDARDRQCQWPGCDRPCSWSTAHHLLHWAQGGSTNLTNLVLLCYRHHGMAHEGGWQLIRTDDGRLLTVPPPWTTHLGARAPDEVPAA